MMLKKEFVMTKGAYMDFKYKITLFTPTYNRGYILETLYKSIQRQTFHDF